MVDPFVKAQNRLKPMSHSVCVTRSGTRQSHAVRFSFIPAVMKSPGLKPIEIQNARSSSAYVPYPATPGQVVIRRRGLLADGFFLPPWSIPDIRTKAPGSYRQKGGR